MNINPHIYNGFQQSLNIALAFNMFMKKSRLTLFLIVAIFMMSLLVFEASALTAYGQTCTSDGDCTSGKCRVEIDAEKTCGCARDTDCSNSMKCNTANNFCTNKKISGATCVANSQCYSSSCTGGRCAAGGPAIDANKISGIVCETGSPGWLDHLDAFGTMIKVNSRELTNTELTSTNLPGEVGSLLPETQISIYSVAPSRTMGWVGPWDVATGDRGTGGMLTIRVTSIFNNPVSANNRCADITATRSTFTAAPAIRELSALVPESRDVTPVDSTTGGSGSTIEGTACTTNSQCPAGQTCQACPAGARCTSPRLCLLPAAAIRCSTNTECGAGKECVGRTWAPTQRQMKINGAECTESQQCATGVCFSGHCVGCTTEGTRRCPTTGDRCGTMGICQSANTMICFSPLRCQSGFCERAYGQEQGRCQSQSSRCTSNADCTSGGSGWCNTVAGVCEIRGECRTIAAPAGGDTGACAALTGVNKIKCDINALIANMQARAGRI